MNFVASGSVTAFTAQEASDLLGVAERSVRRWIASGELPAEKIGRSFAIQPADLDDFAAIHLRRRLDSNVARKDLDRAFAELQGRYDQLRELFEQVQQELTQERRRVARLELERELKAA